MDDVNKSSWLYSSIVNLDRLAFFLFSGLSLVMMIFSFFYGNHINYYCLVVSFFIMIVLAVLALIRDNDLLPPYLLNDEKDGETDGSLNADISGPRISHGKKFQLSKLKDTHPNEY